ncbi:MAG: HepT-like ribonuclease domain-containing protein [Gemmobacter sp.]
MRQAAVDALGFADGMHLAEFLTDLRTQRAVVMCLMIVGEAANRVMADHPAFADAQPGIPWRAIRGMRNRIAHGYFDIDLAVVWQTVQPELPPLVAQLDEGRD